MKILIILSTLCFVQDIFAVIEGENADIDNDVDLEENIKLIYQVDEELVVFSILGDLSKWLQKPDLTKNHESEPYTISLPLIKRNEHEMNELMNLLKKLRNTEKYMSHPKKDEIDSKLKTFYESEYCTEEYKTSIFRERKLRIVDKSKQIEGKKWLTLSHCLHENRAGFEMFLKKIDNLKDEFDKIIRIHKPYSDRNLKNKDIYLKMKEIINYSGYCLLGVKRNMFHLFSGCYERFLEVVDKEKYDSIVEYII